MNKKAFGIAALTILLAACASAPTEDFSNNSRGWVEFGPDEAGSSITVRDGAYHLISIFQGEGVDDFIWGGSTALSFTDFDLKVEAAQVEGTDDNEIAVVFGGQNSDNFYEFAYSGDGFFGFFQYVDGEYDVVRNFDSSDAINQGNATNQIRLVVEDGTLTAYINGQQVMITDIPGYEGGFIGFGCGPFDVPQAHCSFDNLEVS